MMKASYIRLLTGFSALVIVPLLQVPLTYAQTAAPAGKADPTQAPTASPAGLSDDELEILVARIALYPDELVAAISAASLFPLQIVEAARFLEAKKKDSALTPKSDWDGSVISLLNYPDVVKMMNDDLAWTQALGDALTNQQKDVLVAIQQLRDEAIAKNIIKTDDKVTIVNEGDNVIIRSTNPEKVYVPQYPAEMLYQPGYVAAPISYYPEPYDNYYYPGAAFFAGAVTGIAWAAIVNWDNLGIWSGRWGNNVDIDCNNCFNNRNFNGKVKLNDIDWKNVDRSKLNIGRDQINTLDRASIRSDLQSDNRNQLRNQAGNLQRERSQSRGEMGARAADVRKGTAQGLKPGAAQRPQAGTNKGQRAAGNKGTATPRPQTRPANSANRPNKPTPRTGQQGNKPKMASKADNRGRQPSALGNVQSGRRESMNSQRGGQSMGGAHRAPPRAAQHHSRPPVARGGGGGRGGGGRGGRR